MLCLQGEPVFQSGNSSARADDLQLPAAAVKLLVESVSDYAIYMLDLEGRVVTWNVGAERVKGYTREEVLGRNVSMFFPPDAQEGGVPERQLAAAARDGRSETEGWLLRKSGDRFWAQVVLTAIHDADGKLQGFAKVTRDMTAQRTADEKLQRRNAQLERYRIVVENIADHVIFTLDAEGRIDSWSCGAQNTLQHTAEEVLGRAYSTVFPEKDANEDMNAEMKEAARSGHCVTDSWQTRRDGTLFWASGVLTAIRDAAGNLTGYIRVSRDLTPQKELEESLASLAVDMEQRVKDRTAELESAVEVLRTKNEEVEALVSVISHDLGEKKVLLREVYHRVKNNLQVVQSLLKMGARGLRSDDAREAIETAVQRVHAMALVHERLYQVPDLSSMTLSAYLRDVVEGVIASNSERPGQVKLQLDIDEIPVVLDFAIPLGLLANELVSNCLKHGLRHGRAGAISIFTKVIPGAVRFVVQDDGPGLPETFDAAAIKKSLDQLQTVTHKLVADRGVWLHVAEGALALNGVALTTGDGASTEEPGTLTLTATEPTEAILFDLK